jgi:hypothetical protein
VRYALAQLAAWLTGSRVLMNLKRGCFESISALCRQIIDADDTAAAVSGKLYVVKPTNPALCVEQFVQKLLCRLRITTAHQSCCLARRKHTDERPENQ